MQLDEEHAKCMVCQGFLRTPVHVVCRKACGVKLCQECWEELRTSADGRPKCVTCMGRVFPDLTAKDCVLDGILSQCVRPCMHVGCTHPPDASDAIAVHEAVCPHRLVQCPHTACRRSMPQMDLLSHINTCAKLTCQELPNPTTYLHSACIRLGCNFTGTRDDVAAHRLTCAMHGPLMTAANRGALKHHLSSMWDHLHRRIREREERELAQEVADLWDVHGASWNSEPPLTGITITPLRTHFRIDLSDTASSSEAPSAATSEAPFAAASEAAFAAFTVPTFIFGND